MSLSTEQLTTWHPASAEPARKRVSLQDGVMILCIFIVEVTPHHLCCVLWVKSKSQLTSHLRERHKHPEVGVWGVMFYKRVDNTFLGWVSRLNFQGLKFLWFSLVTVSPYTQKINIFSSPFPNGEQFPTGLWGDPLPNFPHFSLQPVGP